MIEQFPTGRTRQRLRRQHQCDVFRVIAVLRQDREGLVRRVRAPDPISPRISPLKLPLDVAQRLWLSVDSDDRRLHTHRKYTWGSDHQRGLTATREGHLAADGDVTGPTRRLPDPHPTSRDVPGNWAQQCPDCLVPVDSYGVVDGTGPPGAHPREVLDDHGWSPGRRCAGRRLRRRVRHTVQWAFPTRRASTPATGHATAQGEACPTPPRPRSLDGSTCHRPATCGSAHESPNISLLVLAADPQAARGRTPGIRTYGPDRVASEGTHGTPTVVLRIVGEAAGRRAGCDDPNPPRDP